MTPIEKLLGNADPKVLAAFEAAYKSPQFNKNGVCNRCLCPIDLMFRTNHRDYHKSVAKKEWVIVSTLNALLESGFFRFE